VRIIPKKISADIKTLCAAVVHSWIPLGKHLFWMLIFVLMLERIDNVRKESCCGGITESLSMSSNMLNIRNSSCVKNIIFPSYILLADFSSSFRKKIPSQDLTLHIFWRNTSLSFLKLSQALHNFKMLPSLFVKTNGFMHYLCW
jgi:hypothetical protein